MLFRSIAPAFLIQAALLAEYTNDRATQNKFVSQLKAQQNLPTHVTLQLAKMLYRDNDSDAAMEIAGRLPRGFDGGQVMRFISTASGPITIPRQIAAGIVDASLISQDPRATRMRVAWLSLALYLDTDADAARFLLARAIGNDRPDASIDQQLASIQADSVWNQPRLLIQLDRRRRDDLTGAITQLEEVVATDQDNGFLFKELADFYRFNDQFAKARDAYLTALELGYTATDIDRSLAIAYERLDQDDLAELYVQQMESDIASINYYRAFAQWRLACIGEGVYARYLGGQQGEQDEEIDLDRMRDSVAERAERAAQLLGMN